jgi:hypothetical protein
VQKVLVFHGETGKITQITCFNKNCLKLFVFQREIEKIEKKAVVETQAQKQLCKTETEKFNYRLAKCWHSMLKNDVLRFGAETCFSFGGYDIVPKEMKPPGP